MVTELDGKKLSAPNDLAIDNNDNIWFSDQIGNVDTKPELSFSCVVKAERNSDGSYTSKRMTYDCTSPNGLIFSKGFAVTLGKLNHASESGEVVTTHYPEEKRSKPKRLHGRHVLNRYEDGMEKCIGCELCASVCPANCIYVRGADNDPESPTSPGERFGFIYEINYLRCIHCDLCVEACPTQAITETKLFEFSFTDRKQAIYTKDELVVDDTGKPQHLPWEDWRPGEDQYTSEWMRATSPSGSASYEGQIQWAGELGYGVRPSETGQSNAPEEPQEEQ